MLDQFLAHFPWYLDRCEGATVVDVDGREFIDLMGSYGPNLLGHRHPRVERAAAAQRNRGDAMGGLGEVTLELAEFLIDRFDPFDWVFTAKNGSDVTGYALKVARQATGRSKVLIAETAYHTSQDWGTMFPNGVPDSHRAQTIRFLYNDPASLRSAVASAGNDLAAIMVTPFHQGFFTSPEVATAEFVAAVQQEARRAGAVVVLDDVRAGMRMHPSGSSCERIGLAPHMVCFGKAVANGRAVSLCVGSDELRSAADEVGYLGTFFGAAEGHAACLETFRTFDAEGSYHRLLTVGERLVNGLAAGARAAGLTVDVSGYPTMAKVHVGDEPGPYLDHVWAAGMVRRGVLVHPTVAWYSCAALTDDQIATVIERGAECFATDVAEEVALRA
jgi:glutamate-1-semialdehyde 2,1-aminomutase